MIAVKLDSYSRLNASAVIWNISHPITQHLKHDYESTIARIMIKKDGAGSSKLLVDPLLFKAELLDSRELAAAFVGWCIKEGHGRLWLGLTEKAPEFLKAIWELLFGAQDVELQYVSGENMMRAVTSSTWVFHDFRAKWGLQLIGKVLPLPPDEWAVTGDEPDLRRIFGDES